MTRTRIAAVAGAVVVAGALFVGGTTWVSAQTPPAGWAAMHGAMGGMQGHGAMAGTADHSAMMGPASRNVGHGREGAGTDHRGAAGADHGRQEVPQIAQEKGVNLDTLRTTMMAQHQADGTHRGMGGRFQSGTN